MDVEEEEEEEELAFPLSVNVPVTRATEPAELVER